MGLDLDQARRQAKELLRAARSGDARALARFRTDRTPRLADAQAAVARELGFRSWPALVSGVVLVAVDEGDDEVVTRLLDAGVPIDARGRFEGSALHYAGLWGRASTLRLLIGRGADVGAVAEPPDRGGVQEWTALDWTAWGSRGATAAAERQAGYRECVSRLLDAGARITERAPIAHLIDEIRDVGRDYLPGRPVRIRVRLRGTNVDVDDLGGAVAVAGMPPGWLAAARRAVAELDWNVRRSGVVVMQAPRGRALEWIIARTAQASVAVCDAILQLGDDTSEPRYAERPDRG
ncbi:MAG: ankyrin repeat domain-containing protein [Solirubrobacteraceae bacterium]